MKPNYHWVRLDETRQWPSRFLSSIGPNAKIYSTFVFDKNNIISSLDSNVYTLSFVNSSFTTEGDLIEAEQEHILRSITDHNSSIDNIKYYNCTVIDNKANPIRHFIDCSSAVTIEDVIRYYKKHPW